MQRPDGVWDRFDDYVVDFALAHMRAGERVAIVTLVAIDGSSPRPLGAQMAVTHAGEWVGYLSGGCIERAVVAEAIEAIEAGRNRRVRYGRGSKYLDIQLPCGSAIELDFDVTLTARELEAIDSRIRAGLPASMTVGDGLPESGAVAIRQYRPRRRLVVVGTGPAAFCLARLGHSTGFETVLLSPDRATRTLCEGEGLTTISIESAGSIPELRADARSAIVFMFHDHEWEAALLPAALRTEACYIGAMGSHKAHAARLKKLRELGIPPSSRSRIRGPAGLFHGAKNAQSIAVSILAEIMEAEASSAVPDLTIVEQDSMDAFAEGVPHWSQRATQMTRGCCDA